MPGELEEGKFQLKFFEGFSLNLKNLVKLNFEIICFKYMQLPYLNKKYLKNH